MAKHSIFAVILPPLILLSQCITLNAFVVPKDYKLDRLQQHRISTFRPASTKEAFTHEDIMWKIRPPPEATKRDFLKWKIAANVLRWECLIRRQKAPTVLCPNNFPQIVLEAHTTKSSSGDGQKPQKIGRFGISCVRGPSAPPIGETVQSLYNIDPGFTANLGIAAIVYMFVEPEFRGRQVGNLALETIALIHAAINADFTILVADDTSGVDERALVKWYEKYGFSRAPLLQNMMGSPDEQFGVAMIAPTNGSIIPEGCRIQWW